MKHVLVLVGPKGAGKSTIGHILATDLGLHFLRVEPIFLDVRARLGASHSEFEAAGFSKPVSGVVYRSDKPPCCGVTLGGISTGCLDIDARGVYGWSTLFNPVGPHPLAKEPNQTSLTRKLQRNKCQMTWSRKPSRPHRSV